VSTAIDHGEPLMAGTRSDPVLRELAGLAGVLSPRPQDARSLLQRLLGRSPAPARTSGGRHVLS
jgi:hypothetical protein